MTMLLATGLLIGVALATPKNPLDVTRLVDLEQHEVPWVSTSSLAGRIGRVQLLDVREPGEYAISHLRNARNVSPTAARVRGLDPSKPVIVYCSVGFRSARLGARLKDRGFRVHNLAGGIFQWANEGRPLVDARGPAQTVHPYDAVWGRLLKADLREPTGP